MCTDLTPPRAASSAELIFGNMPPDSVPSATSSSICFGVRPVSSLPLLSSTPGVLVNSTSFSAFSTSANLPATTSALMFSVSPSGPTAIGAMTGIKSPESRKVIIDGSIKLISPTRPMSSNLPGSSRLSSSILSARINEESCPVSPTALPPYRLIKLTMSLLTLPSAISTTSMVSSSVTRMPWTNAPCLPMR